MFNLFSYKSTDFHLVITLRKITHIDSGGKLYHCTYWIRVFVITKLNMFQQYPYIFSGPGAVKDDDNDVDIDF